MMRAGLAVLAVIGLTHRAWAQTAVGTVSVCYYSGECPYANVPGMKAQPTAQQRYRDTGEHPLTPQIISRTTFTQVDAPAFLFTNTGSAAITGARFLIKANSAASVVADHYQLGTIMPGASIAIVPGASNDKKTHPAGGFFTYIAPGEPLDTSDSGPDDNTIVFAFEGKIGKQKVTSGNILVGKSAGPSMDGTVASLNFLGGPGNADAPCGDCFGNTVIAQLTVKGGD
jgi:hypothetical protein